MSARIPLDDEVENLGLKFVQVGEVGHDQSLAMDDGKPLLDLVHPGTVHGGEVHVKARMHSEPGAHQFAMMGADVVADQVDVGNGAGSVAVDFVQQLDKLDLPFALSADAEDLAGPGIEGGQ